MLVQSFVSVIESAVADHGTRNISGYVTNVNELCSAAAMRALEEAHPGCFGFLAFDGKADPIVADYVANGSLAADSGPGVLVLFTTQAPIAAPRQLSLGMLNGTALLDDGKHPAYDYVRKLAPDVTHPPLPCVVLFHRFTGRAQPILVGLGDAASVAELRSRLQTVFGLANASASDGNFTDGLCAALAAKGIAYTRGGHTSMREWLASLLLWARENASTVVSILRLFR